jgi:hypothetical protein
MNNQNPILNALQDQKQPLLNQLLQNNPQVAYVMQYVQQHGGNPKDAFFAMAQEKGVDPMTIINSLKK